MNMLMNLLVNLSPNSFQIVIYEHFCVCIDAWWFTCMPLSFFVHLSAYFSFVVSTQHVNIIMKYKTDPNLWYCFTLETRSFHVSKMYQNK